MTDWPSLVREHGPAVWRTAFRLLGNRADADECFQDTFAGALSASQASAEPIRSWGGLLVRLATARGFKMSFVKKIAAAASFTAAACLIWFVFLLFGTFGATVAYADVVGKVTAARATAYTTRVEVAGASAAKSMRTI